MSAPSTDLSLRALLVDDEEDSYVLIRGLLEASAPGHVELEWARSYEAGLAALTAGTFDVALVDFKLGHGQPTGLELIRAGSALDTCCAMILLTSQGDREIDLEAMRLGAASFIDKADLVVCNLDRSIRYAVERERLLADLRESHAGLEERVRTRTCELEEVNAALRREIAERERAEHESARLAAIVASSEDAIIGFTVDGIVTSWNDSASRLYGYTAEESLGTDVRLLIPTNEHRGFDADLARLRRGEPIPTYETVWVANDGRRIDLAVTLSPIRDAHGHVGGGSSIGRDIGKRKHTEERLRRSEEALRQAQKMEAVGRLAGGVAHDFNNLVTVIEGYASMLLVSLADDSRAREMLEEIHRAGERAGALTRQLLAYSRKQVLNQRALDVSDLVRGIERLLQRLVGEDIEVATSLGSEPCFVRADPNQLEQVLMNLGANARDAMPTGGRMTITTSHVELGEGDTRMDSDVHPGSHVRLVVTDSGVGMDAATLDQIFEPFFTTKDAGCGTGLGLATVFGIVKQSGGHIRVSSEVGRGTTFEILLPCLDTHLDADPVPIDDAPRGRAETILLVEDDPAVRSLTRNILETAGYEVLEAANGEDALDLASREERGVSLLLTDLVMPRMGGRRLADELVEAMPSTRVLFMSGYTEDAIVRHGIARDDSHFLDKPFTPRGLLHKVRAVLDAAR